MDHPKESKLGALIRILKTYQSVAVAYSGGVDSTFLTACAKKALGDNAIAITARSPIHPKEDLQFAKAMAEQIGIRHLMVDTDELKDPEFVRNTKERCYYCKKEMFQKILKAAAEEGISTVVHGITVDDLSDHRPGIIAAEEMGVLAPMVEVGLGKKEIRKALRTMNIIGWDKPASPCFVTRIPYGHEITLEKIGQVRKAEKYLRTLGFKILRVRNWDGLGVIEVEQERIGEFIDQKKRDGVIEAFQGLGFKVVAIDLEGYKMGKMNRF